MRSALYLLYLNSRGTEARQVREYYSEEISKQLPEDGLLPFEEMYPVTMKSAKNQREQIMKNMLAYSLRSKGLLELVSVNDLTNYGCWCTEDPLARRGPPLDVIDHGCRARHFCQKCVTLDSPSDFCEPDATYSVIIDARNKTLSCAHSENSNCAKKLCECDLEYVDNTVQHVSDGKFYAFYSRNVLDFQRLCSSKERNFWGDYGDYTEQQDSKIVELLDMNISRMKMPDIPEECCGIHPNRFPFQATGNRSCCGSKTYDPEVFDCCQGQIKAIGEC